MAFAPSPALLHLLAQLAHSLLGSSGALRAHEFCLLVPLVVFQLLYRKLTGTKIAAAHLAAVRLQITRVEPHCAANLAYQRCLLRRSVFLAFFLGPIRQLVCRLTSAASQLRLTVLAHQAGLLLSLRVLPQVREARAAEREETKEVPLAVPRVSDEAAVQQW